MQDSQCKSCKNSACYQAGTDNKFMRGSHTCSSYQDGTPKPVDEEIEFTQIDLSNVFGYMGSI